MRIEERLDVSHVLDRERILRVADRLGLLQSQPMLGRHAAFRCGNLLEDPRLERVLDLLAPLLGDDVEVQVAVANVPVAYRSVDLVL